MPLNLVKLGSYLEGIETWYYANEPLELDDVGIVP